VHSLSGVPIVCRTPSFGGREQRSTLIDCSFVCRLLTHYFKTWREGHAAVTADRQKSADGSRIRESK
jgi:hypothetical protein